MPLTAQHQNSYVNQGLEELSLIIDRSFRGHSAINIWKHFLLWPDVKIAIIGVVNRKIFILYL